MRSVRDSRPTDSSETPAVAPADAATALAALTKAQAFNEHARRLAENAPPKRRHAFAQAFVRRVVGRYWDAKQPRSRRALRPCPVPVEEPKREALELADAFGVGAALLEVDQAAYVLGRTYAAMLPQDFRSEHGVFYTPPAVVRRLLDSIEGAGIDWANARVLEPACGGGAFLGPLARRMVRHMRGADRRFIARNLRSRLTGYEIDPFSAWLSTVFLDATLEEELGISSEDELAQVDVVDSLSRLEEDSFDLVIANPPYGRVALDVERRAAFKRSLYGHANLYGLFLDLALRKTKPNGLIAYVTPTGFLCGEYFKRLRSLLAEEAPPIALDFLSERAGVFDDVLQETLLALFRRGAGRRKVVVSFVAAAAADVTVTPVDVAPLPSVPEQPWIVARSVESTGFATRLRDLPGRLSDWGYQVRTGPLVWNRHKDQLLSKTQRGAVPLLWAEAVNSDGTFEFRAARRNHAPYFLPKDGDDWLLIRKPCVLLQRTTAKEQARRLIAAELPPSFLDEHGAVTVENHLNMLVALNDAPAVTSRALAAFLNSGAADRAFRCISGTVAVSAYELENMPLPAPWALKELDKLVAGSAAPAEVERFCDRLFGDR